MRILVAYDGSLQAKEALMYGIGQIMEKGGELLVLHVFNSPLFIGYDSHPRAEEIARHESELMLEEAKKIAHRAGPGMRIRFAAEEGDPEEEIIRFTGEKDIEILLCPPRYGRAVRRYKKILARNGKKMLEDSKPGMMVLFSEG